MMITISEATLYDKCQDSTCYILIARYGVDVDVLGVFESHSQAADARQVAMLAVEFAKKSGVLDESR